MTKINVSNVNFFRNEPNQLQQQQQQTQPQQAVGLQSNAIKQVNKVKPNVNRQQADSAVSPSTYNR